MIKYLVMDVDGTLTDGKINIGPDGEMYKSFNAKDGYGIVRILPELGIIPVIITGRESEIVEFRAKELDIKHVYQGVHKKEEKLSEITNDFSEVAFIGDDCNDLSIVNAVKARGGLVGTPRDAVKEIKDNSDFISEKCGGEGAVRDFIEWIRDSKYGGRQ